jgi:lipopolysaccharide transport system ATP-binding protein
MSSENWVFRLRGVSKKYRMYRKPHDRLKDLLSEVLMPARVSGRNKRFQEHHALRDVDLTVCRGETLGIVGVNGSGKSTLLQVMAGILAQSSGTVERKGKVAALLELGAGFNPDFSGRENVYLNAALFGLTRSQTDARIQDILEFADIGDFIDQPVRTYSSGMVVRLAFAIITNVDADILIIDEALAVGDVFFVQKCMAFLRKYMERGTLVFVSHDTNLVLNLCSRAVLISNGSVVLDGDPKRVVERYLATLHGGENHGQVAEVADVVPERSVRDMRQDLLLSSAHRNDIEIFEFDPKAQSFGFQGAQIVHVALTNESGDPYSWVVGGEVVRLNIHARVVETLENVILGFNVKDRLGQLIFGDNTYLSTQAETRRVNAGEEVRARFVFRMPVLPPGDYTLTAAIADGTQEEHRQQHWIHDAIVVKSHASSSYRGLVGIPMESISLEIAGASDGPASLQ